MRLLIAGVLLALLVPGAWVVVAFRSDMKAHRERISGRTTVVQSPWGEIEYLERGSGPAVLVVHGGGGGFDQGELVLEAVLGDGFRAVIPSRFGYLRSRAAGEGTFDEQAHAFDWLLGHLGIERAAVVALSQGGPSALLLAVLHPDRVSSLTLLSAGAAPVTVADQEDADARGRMLVRLYRWDFPYWALTRLFERQMMSLMGADRDVAAGLDEGQRDWIRRVIDEMNPASPRSEGAVLDNRNPMPGGRIAAIRAPTLIVHAEDDRLQLFENAAFAAATIPSAVLMRFPRGGHFVIATEREAVSDAVRRHVLAHSP